MASVLDDIEAIVPHIFTTPRDIWWRQRKWSIAMVRQTLLNLHHQGRVTRARAIYPYYSGRACVFLYRRIEREPIAARA